MSQQSILELSQHRYARETETALLNMSDAYFNKKNFLLGPGTDPDKICHAMLFHEFLCDSGCEIINYIEDKIKGRLENAGFIPKKKKLRYLFEQCEEDLKCAPDAAMECCGWEQIEW